MRASRARGEPLILGGSANSNIDVFVECIGMVGKRVSDELYIHLDAVDLLDDAEQRERILGALTLTPRNDALVPNVAKLNLRSGRLSLLAYPDFDLEPFPQLAASWIFASGSLSTPNYRHYADTLNPPILHRKELLVRHDHPDRTRWIALTETAESLGLFDNPSTIGFKLNWERLIREKGYALAGYNLTPVANVVYADSDADATQSGDAVRRHLTALSRGSLSAPVQLLMRHGLLGAGRTFFDYGCGKGDDVAGLTASGVEASGWDPHFAAENPIVEADVVNLGFVVNVIEDPAERVEAIHRSFKLTRGVMSIGVMLSGNEPPGRPFRDGFITSRNTFQKYFTQGEFKDYIEQVLNQDVFMAGPGVAFVFFDKDLEQRFATERYRRRGLAKRLLAANTPGLRRVREAKSRPPREQAPARATTAQLALASIKPELERLWITMLDLGRKPEPDEVDALDQLEDKAGSLNRALRLIASHFDPDLLSVAAKARADDVRLFMAAQQFKRRPAYRRLELRLQRDIRAFFGDYEAAQSAGVGLLLDAADPVMLLDACRVAAAAWFGWLENEHSLQIHATLVERLPVVLRAYVACGLILWDSIGDVQLVKIHITSGKLTLMQFEDFDVSAIPRLSRRIKVNIRKQDYQLFEYGGAEHPKPLLYRKSRYLHEDYPNYAEQFKFDEALEATGLLDDSEFGPSEVRLRALLEEKRLRVAGFFLVPSEDIPELDMKCGANFTFRSFIECGETQRRLAIQNIPLNPKTYNAIHALATRIIDPVVEYFGAIKLTYGFCSAGLARHIHLRVAPELDQHASYELNRLGRPICPRGGAACDFIVEDEDMRQVADWIIANLPFDRLYFYGSDRPIHVSFAVDGVRQAYTLTESKSGRLIPRKYC